MVRIFKPEQRGMTCVSSGRLLLTANHNLIQASFSPFETLFLDTSKMPFKEDSVLFRPDSNGSLQTYP